MIRELLAGVVLAGGTPATLAPATVTLVVQVEGIEAMGEIRVAVCDRSFDEVGCPKGALRQPKAGHESFIFEVSPRSRHAVAVYQDANGNGRLDTILGGVPTEPYGFSNDVGRLAPPSFDSALVTVGSEPRTVVTVRLRRLFGA